MRVCLRSHPSRTTCFVAPCAEFWEVISMESKADALNTIQQILWIFPVNVSFMQQEKYYLKTDI
jgi:hypothetical protein